MRNSVLKSVLAASVMYAMPACAQTTLYGLTNANAIFTMSNPSSPSSVSGPYTVSGVASSQVLVSLDSRPSDGMLYALGYDSVSMKGQLYKLTASGSTYTATALSGTLHSMNLGSTNNASMDFISTVDNQVRVIGRNGNNYIMNANDGSLMSTGTSGMTFAAGDLHIGSGIMAATAYTNNFYGSDNTQQVGYDAVNNVLVMMDAGTYANGWNNASNTMHSIGVTTGAALMTTSGVGMDTWYDTMTHTNTIYMSGTALLGGNAHLYRYSLSGMTGAVTDLGVIGSGSMSVRDIAFGSVAPNSSAAVEGQLVTALTLNLRNLIFFDSRHPENIRRMVRLNGMTTGQSMVGIDYSSNGWLYGLGYNSTSHTYQLYKVDTMTGNVTAVNSTAGTLDLGTDDGSGNYVNAGFRFIATHTDKIRVIGKNGMTNVQLNAATGAIASTDNSLQYVSGDANYGSTVNLTSIAYTGNSGTSQTQMFGFDANTGAMIKFNMDNTASGWGDGTIGYMSTDISLSTILSLLFHTSTYNNTHMNIAYDNNIDANVGVMAANYYGDSSVQNNYSVMYDMTSMLSAYGKATATSPERTGNIGWGTPVKDVTMRRSTAPTGIAGVNGTVNNLLAYPNPVINSTRIVLNEIPQNTVSVEVVDMNGNLVRNYNYAAGTTQLDVDMSRLSTGMYNARVISNGLTTQSIKIVKE